MIIFGKFILRGYIYIYIYNLVLLTYVYSVSIVKIENEKVKKIKKPQVIHYDRCFKCRLLSQGLLESHSHSRILVRLKHI